MCTICGDEGHNSRTCPSLRAEDGDRSDKRGQRESPRTPVTEAAKLEKLRGISTKLSPKPAVPPLPQGSANEELATPASASLGTPVTMEAMPALLAAQLGPITGSVNRLETDLKEFKTKVESDIGEVKHAAKSFKEDLDHVKVRLSHVEERGVDEAIMHRIDGIEKQISNLKILPVPDKNDLSTAVVGGLEGASSADAAMSWLKEAMSKTRIDGVVDVYHKCKDGDFNGMIFVKFSSAEQRKAAMIIFNDTKSAFMDNRTYMNKDLPVQQRAKFSFLHNLKKLLAAWGFENIKFDDTSWILSVGGIPVIQARTDEFTFKPKWLVDTWGQWEELTKDPKFMELVKAAEAKLKKASQSGTKGKGKTSGA